MSRLATGLAALPRHPVSCRFHVDNPLRRNVRPRPSFFVPIRAQHARTSDAPSPKPRWRNPQPGPRSSPLPRTPSVKESGSLSRTRTPSIVRSPEGNGKLDSFATVVPIPRLPSRRPSVVPRLEVVELLHPFASSRKTPSDFCSTRRPAGTTASPDPRTSSDTQAATSRKKTPASHAISRSRAPAAAPKSRTRHPLSSPGSTT